MLFILGHTCAHLALTLELLYYDYTQAGPPTQVSGFLAYTSQLVSGLQHKLAGFWLPTQVSGYLAYTSQLVSGIHKSVGFWPPTQVGWFLASHTSQWVSGIHKSVGFWPPIQVGWFLASHTSQRVSGFPHKSVGFWPSTQISWFLAYYTSQYFSLRLEGPKMSGLSPRWEFSTQGCKSIHPRPSSRKDQDHLLPVRALS